MTHELPRTRAGLEPLLAARGLRPSRRRGQNFLVDAALADAIVADADVGPTDHVLEIGPGAGALTQPLLAVAGHVTAIELDRGLAELLREALGEHPRLTLVEGDALADDGPGRLHAAIDDAIRAARAGAFERVLVVANLPYSAGTAMVSRLLRRDDPPDSIVAMLQREVVDRLRAETGTKAYGPLAVIVRLRADVSVLRRVPRDVFFPRPDVESVVFRLALHGTDPGGTGTVQTDGGQTDGAAARAAVDLAERGFSQRRKRLARVLRGVVTPEQLAACGIDADARAERVSPDAWRQLAALVENCG